MIDCINYSIHTIERQSFGDNIDCEAEFYFRSANNQIIAVCKRCSRAFNGRTKLLTDDTRNEYLVQEIMKV